jgi:hypothetical protein
MKQLTLRGIDEVLEQKIKSLALEKNISLNKAALLLIKKGAGLNAEPKTNVVGNSLNAFIGSWSEEDYDEFRYAVSGL